MRLNFDAKTLETSCSNNITGVISIVLANNRFFPEQYWNDSVVIILNSWIQDMVSILSGKSNEAKFFFFDGPFYFTITGKGLVYTIELFQNSKHTGIYNIDANKFGYHLTKSSKDILTEINKKGWESNEIRQFTISIKDAQSYFNL